MPTVNRRYTFEQIAAWTPPVAATASGAKLGNWRKYKDQFDEADVETSYYEELPAGLRKEFEAYGRERTELELLWHGKPPKWQDDISDSGFEFALAKILQRAEGKFSILDYARLVAVWEFRSEKHEHDFHRRVTRSWNNAAAPDPAAGFEPIDMGEQTGGAAAGEVPKGAPGHDYINKPFKLDKNDRPKSKDSGNILLAIRKLGVTIRYDAFHDRMTVEGLPGYSLLDDPAFARLMILIEERFGLQPPKDYFHMVIGDIARLNQFHPVRQYLDGLKWDGVPRNDRWLIDCAGAKDTPYVRAVSALMLIAAVRRVRQPGCKFDEMVVLESEQGKDKSSALAILAVKPDWFSDDLPLTADTKLVIERLRGRWIVEAAELKGMRKADVEHLKSFLSRREDRARMAYGREVTEQPRQCIVVGTTNHSEYLRDQTGNRRFWPVAVEAFDLDRLKAERDQLWAEAAVREARGDSIRLDRSLWKEAEAEQEERLIDDPWIAEINEVLGDMTGKVVAADMWLIVGVPTGQRTQEQNGRLGAAVRALGWEHKNLRFDGRKQWGYQRCDGDGDGLKRIRVRQGSPYSKVTASYESDPSDPSDLPPASPPKDADAVWKPVQP